MGNYRLMSFRCGAQKNILEMGGRMVAQQCESTKRHCIVLFETVKTVNFTCVYFTTIFQKLQNAKKKISYLKEKLGKTKKKWNKG